ncbi:hypothetical protein F5Y05DRAFT_366700 [Hypoxylon sp. FL0543]|nr:hypothetical protein F5Y05DRAFT_366700 [Hypoxylon sp. FL0543]
MAPRRKEPSPTEADSGSEADSNVDPQYTPSASIPEAMKQIDTWKTKRTNLRKSTEEKFVEKLASLRERMQESFEDESQKMSDHNKEQLRKLVAALNKRLECEEKISERIDSLRDDCAHVAMLVDAVYAGRKEAAAQSAKAFKPNQLEN